MNSVYHYLNTELVLVMKEKIRDDIDRMMDRMCDDMPQLNRSELQKWYHHYIGSSKVESNIELLEQPDLPVTKPSTARAKKKVPVPKPTKSEEQGSSSNVEAVVEKPKKPAAPRAKKKVQEPEPIKSAEQASSSNVEAVEVVEAEPSAIRAQKNKVMDPKPESEPMKEAEEGSSSNAAEAIKAVKTVVEKPKKPVANRGKKKVMDPVDQSTPDTLHVTDELKKDSPVMEMCRSFYPE